MELHAPQIQGFFDIPVDNIYGSPVLVDDIEDQRFENLMIVSPDIGGVVRARAVAKSLGVDLGIIDKRREKANHSEVMHIIGDVEGRTCILVDDMVDTAGTLCLAAQALKDHGAERVVAYITHPVLSGAAVERIGKSQLDELVVTDTIPLSEDAKSCPKIVQLSVSHLLARAILQTSRSKPHDLAGKTTVLQLGAVLQRCAAVVSGDTGPMHMATAVGTPVTIVGTMELENYVIKAIRDE